MTMILEMPPEAQPWQARHVAPIPSSSVRKWVLHSAALCRPEHVYWCDGTEQEQQMLRAQVEAAASREAGHAHEKVPFAPRAIRDVFQECMAGRTLYVVPFIFPKSDRLPQRGGGVQLTDSAAVALSVIRGSLSGDLAWKRLIRMKSPWHCVHFSGGDVARHSQLWRFPSDREIWAYGPDYDAAVLSRSIANF